jgi:type 1 fimbria pilin
MMRKLLLTFGLMVLAAPAGTAAAQTEFDIEGEIEPGTCEWAIQDIAQTVVLDPIDASVLNAKGSGNFKTFNLQFSSCPPSTVSMTLTFLGTPDANDPLRFQNAGTAQGTAVELESADGSTIGANGTNNSRTIPIVQVPGTPTYGAQLDLQAGYWRVGTVTAGTVESVATFSVTYQ